MNKRRLFGNISAGLSILLASIVFAAASKPASLAANPQQATREAPWENSLGMKFVPVKETAVLFCIWHTRVQDFAAFVKATEGAGKEISKKWQSPGFEQGPAHPVCCVSWEESQAFCQWLTKKEQAEGKLPAEMQYRLPTDAEWSVAVGLGTEKGKTPHEKDSRIHVYPWGKELPPPKGAGNYWGEESRKPGIPPGVGVIAGHDDGFKNTPVGSFTANDSGLYDMGGNVWQWCEDLLDPPQPARVLRGGAWCTNDSEYLLSSRRTAAGAERFSL